MIIPIPVIIMQTHQSRPNAQPPLALEMLMSSIASQLTTMQSSFSSQLGALQSNFSRQLSAMSQQQSQLMDRLDRVEESIHGSGKGSPNLDFWTTRPAVTAFPAVVPEPLDQPQSRTLTLRESSYAKGSCP